MVAVILLRDEANPSVRSIFFRRGVLDEVSGTIKGVCAVLGGATAIIDAGSTAIGSIILRPISVSDVLYRRFIRVRVPFSDVWVEKGRGIWIGNVNDNSSLEVESVGVFIQCLTFKVRRPFEMSLNLATQTAVEGIKSIESSAIHFAELAGF